mmetsp:Transcript_3941/g.5192  ORF Transcript_3941/g.5192 Transcript_3941/m.5192 type:complete len:286 (+) Transcript_3941:128-985(+)
MANLSREHTFKDRTLVCDLLVYPKKHKVSVKPSIAEKQRSLVTRLRLGDSTKNIDASVIKHHCYHEYYHQNGQRSSSSISKFEKVVVNNNDVDDLTETDVTESYHDDFGLNISEISIQEAPAIYPNSSSSYPPKPQAEKSIFTSEETIEEAWSEEEAPRLVHLQSTNETLPDGNADQADQRKESPGIRLAPSVECKKKDTKNEQSSVTAHDDLMAFAAECRNIGLELEEEEKKSQTPHGKKSLHGVPLNQRSSKREANLQKALKRIEKQKKEQAQNKAQVQNREG